MSSKSTPRLPNIQGRCAESLRIWLLLEQMKMPVHSAAMCERTVACVRQVLESQRWHLCASCPWQFLREAGTLLFVAFFTNEAWVSMNPNAGDGQASKVRMMGIICLRSVGKVMAKDRNIEH